MRRVKSTLLWLGVGVLAASVYLLASYVQLHGALRGLTEGSQMQVFVSGSCPHSQPVIASPPAGSVVLPVDWDDEAMTMGLCENFVGDGLFSAVPLRLRCEWLVRWAVDETDEAVGFPAYREGAGAFVRGSQL